jgi:cell division protein FtsQ
LKKYLAISFWVVAAIYFIVVIGYIIKEQQEIICTGVQVFVQDTLEIQFIDDNDVIDLLEADGTRLLNAPISKLNMAELERKINKNQYVKNAQVYKKINGQLVVELEQRIPIVRIMNNSDRNYYIDEEGFLMPVSRKVSARLIVANGAIDYTPDFDTITNIFEKKYDKSKRIKVLRDIHLLAGFIKSNRFWQAQIQQIYISDNDEIELVPLVSNQLIVFGNVDNYMEKFKNLEAVYKKGFTSKGWSNYKEINLKYKNQVVCVKAS